MKLKLTSLIFFFLTFFFGFFVTKPALAYTNFTVTGYDSSTGTFTATSTVPGGVNGGNGDWNFAFDPCSSIYIYSDVSPNHDQSNNSYITHSTSVHCTASGTNLTFQSDDFIDFGYIFLQPNSANNYSASSDFKIPLSSLTSTPTPPTSGYTRFTVTGYDSSTGTFTATSTVPGGVNGGNGDWDFATDPCVNIYIYVDPSLNHDQSNVTHALTHSTAVTCTASGTNLTFQSDDFIDLGYIFVQPNSANNYSASSDFKIPLVNPTPTNTPPYVSPMTVTPNPVQVNSSVTATTTFTDPDTGDTHTAVIDWNDGLQPTTCTVTESNGSGSVTCPRPSGYLFAKLYSPKITVTDNHGAFGDSPPYNYLSVYNPTPQGLFSGARIFTAPAGSYPAQANLSGQVQFGVTAKYDTNGAVTGNVSMKFNAAGLTFTSTTITALVTASGKATLMGTGTIQNQSGTYNFVVTGIDGTTDKVRFQITDSSNNVVFDSQIGAAITDDPTATVTGQVIVH